MDGVDVKPQKLTGQGVPLNESLTCNGYDRRALAERLVSQAIGIEKTNLIWISFYDWNFFKNIIYYS